jgi:hypothetical protein
MTPKNPPDHAATPPKPPPTPSPTTDGSPVVSDRGGACDEVACVMTKYARPCCAKFKPKGDSFRPATGVSLTKMQIRAGVDTVRPAVIGCGEHDDSHGTVKVRVVVAGSGKVKHVEVVSDPDPTLGSCVARMIKLAHFAATTKGGTFVYPFVF